eukprot:3745300-Lingulodinium_polyedra.AAC.1
MRGRQLCASSSARSLKLGPQFAGVRGRRDARVRRASAIAFCILRARNNYRAQAMARAGNIAALLRS